MAMTHGDAAFEALVAGLHQGSPVPEPTVLHFVGLPRARLERAAQALATRLGRALMPVDLASIQSHYIGETEKNLGHLYARAHVSGAILLFDEADALFGKRAAVSGAGDDHARQASVRASGPSPALALLSRYAVLAIVADGSSGPMGDLPTGLRIVRVAFPAA
jgi:SpoVK/Ycf46/Vps4 family AAA+-type ATPase